jgi:hypothetical protein
MSRKVKTCGRSAPGIDGLGPLAQNQFIIRHFAQLAVRLSDRDKFARPIDGGDLMINVRAHARTLPKSLGSHDDQFGAIVNFARDKIGQATVREGNIRPALENLDLGGFIHTACFGRGGRSPGDAPNNDNAQWSLHDGPPELATHPAEQLRARFHGIFANKRARPQVPVSPAKSKPQPRINGMTAK